MEALMGKWAYTNLILYRYPLVTPVIRFSTWLSAVRIAAEVFLDPNHASIFSVLFPVVSSFRSWKSRFRCLKLRVSFPRGPSTSITFACTFIFTPSGISIVSEDTIVFIFFFFFFLGLNSQRLLTTLTLTLATDTNQELVEALIYVCVTLDFRIYILSLNRPTYGLSQSQALFSKLQAHG